MKLRDDQVQAFKDDAKERYTRRLVAHLREHYTESVKGLSEDLLERRVQYGIKQARKYGLRPDRPVAKFVVTMFVVAPNFHREPMFNDVLRDDRYPQGERMERLFDKAKAKNWEEAKNLAGAMNWPRDLQKTSVR